MTKPLLIGMSNPYGSDPKYALYPLPEYSAGGRLYMLLHEATGMSRREYLAAFDRVNLVTGKWTRPIARECATTLLPSLSGRRVILLGRGVQESFGYFGTGELDRYDKIITHLPRRVVEFQNIPHPSGRNFWYNDQSNRDAVKAILMDLCSGQKSDLGVAVS